MAQTILVTGGTGYIGGEVIDQLLASGCAVHTTVRNRAKSEQRLHERWPDAASRLKVFQADLMHDEGWAEANAGCDAVAHIASPFPLAVPKDKDELVVPAREGTLRALRHALAAGITRFVQTSSAAAIAYGHGDREQFDETDWTNLAAGVPPYVESKTVAERAARDWVGHNAPDMVFCSVNPVGVFGPVYNDDLSTSIAFLQKLIDGSIPMIPNMGIGVTDIRDVGKAHVLALQGSADKIRGERFPTSVQFMWMGEMAETLRKHAPEYSGKVATRAMPDWLVKFLALFVAPMKQIAPTLGLVRDVSGKHTEQVLGFDFIPAEQTIADTARSLVERGIVKL